MFITKPSSTVPLPLILESKTSWLRGRNCPAFPPLALRALSRDDKEQQVRGYSSQIGKPIHFSKSMSLIFEQVLTQLYNIKNSLKNHCYC